MPASVSRSQRSSSSVGSASSAFLDKLEAEASGADILDNSSALQAGVFGVLFTVTKEKYNTGWRFLLLKLVLDYLQLFTLTFTDSEPWVFDEKNVIWKVARTVNIDQVIAPLGYNFFIGLLYVMIGLLVLMMGLSLWVAWCFKNRSFPSVWPIKVLRVYANLFFQILDVLTLTLFQVPFNCRYIGYDPSEFNYMANYPDVKCSAFPHIIHMVTSGGSLLIFVVCALLNLGADFELSPLEKGLLSVANGEVEVQAFIVKFAMTFVSYAIGWQKVRLVLLLILAAALTGLYLRWSPHMVSWVNHLRVGLYTSVLLSAILAVVLVEGPTAPQEAVNRHRQRTTTLLWALMGPAALLGAAASYCRLNLWSVYVLKRFRVAPVGEKARRIYKFGDPREVEIVSRVCRQWTDQHREVLDKRAVKEGEIIIKAGLQLFPGRCYMLILYSNYLIDVLDNSQTGYSQMAAAKQAGPDWMQRFAIFAREQEQLQRMSSARGGESGVDLVSYVEYQKNHRLVIRAHKDALIATRTFWQVLLHNQVRFTALAVALNEIERTVLKAESAYKMVLGRYPTNAKLARTYGRFLENVVNNPWKAAKYYVLAERLAEMQEADEAAGAEMAASGGGEAAVENRLLHRVDERVNAVFIINANGIIQMANKNACSLLGYGKGELDGKNINVIMPPPFSQRHNKYVRQYVHTGRETILNTVVSVPALHKDRYVIPVRVGVTKVSGAADSSTFMGVLEPTSLERNEANVYLLPGGTVAAVDRSFVDWFAKELDDCIAQHMSDLTADEASAIAIRGCVDRIAAASKAAVAAATSNINGRGPISVYDTATAAAAAAREAAAAAAHEPPPIVLLRHKYARPVRVTVRLHHVGIGPEALLCATLTRTDPPDSLVLVDGRGRIGFITSELAEALGATPEGLARQPIADLLPQPWNALHANGGGGWLREADASMGNMGAEILGDHRSHPGVGLEVGLGALANHHHHHHHQQHHNHNHNHQRNSQHSQHGQQQNGGGSGGGSGGGNGASAYGAAAAPPGSCLAGQTMVLGSSSKVQDYYRVEVSCRGETATGQCMRVVMVRRSSLAEALNERRLAVVVDAATGTVLEAGDSPTNLFGFKPSTLVGRNIADVVTALRPSLSNEAQASTSAAAPPVASPTGGGGSGGSSLGPMTTTQLLCQLAVASMAVGGTSWRVGVTPPMDERNLEALGLLRGAFLSRQTRAAVMEVDVLVPGGDGAVSEDKKERVSVETEEAEAAGAEHGGGSARRTNSELYGPTFKEMHERGHLSVEAAATIEAGLTALTAPTSCASAPQYAWAVQQAPEGAGLRLRLNFWRSEVLAGVIEVDGQGELVTVAHAKLHQAGLLFGLNTGQMPKMRLGRILHMLPGETHGSATTALFQQPAPAGGATPAAGKAPIPAAPSAVRTALKGNRKPQKVGPVQVLTGHHSDGQPLEVAVQAVVKEGSAVSGRTLVFIKLRNPYSATDQPALLRALEAVAPKRLLRARGRRASAVAAAAVGVTAPSAPSHVPTSAKPRLTGGEPEAPRLRAAAAAGRPEDWNEEPVEVLERGAAVGTGSSDLAHGLVPDPFVEYPRDSDCLAPDWPALRGPAVLGCESDREGEESANRDSGGNGGGGGGGGGGSPTGRRRDVDAKALVGSKDSDDVLIAGVAKYDVVDAAAAAAAAAAATARPNKMAIDAAMATVALAAAMGEDDDDEFDEAEGDGGDSEKERREKENADVDYRSISSSSNSKSSSSSSGSGLKRRSSNSLRVSLDVGIATGARRRSSGGGGAGGKYKSRRAGESSAVGTRRVFLSTPSVKKRDGEDSPTKGGVTGGAETAAGADGARSPPLVRKRTNPSPRTRIGRNSSSNLDNQPSRQLSGGSIVVSGGGTGGGGTGGGGTSMPSMGRRHSGGGAANAADGGDGGEGGLFGDLRGALLAADAAAADGGAGRAGAGGQGLNSGGVAASAGSFVSPGPMNDPDEVGSQGSAVSGMEDEMGGSSHQADYRRGKRFKKLAAMLGSASVQRAAQDFRWQALLANVAQVASNLISFVLLTMLLRAQVKSVGRLSYTAGGVRNVHELFIQMVILDNIHRGLYPNTSWYDIGSMEQVSGLVYDNLVQFSEHHHSSFLDSGTGRITTTVPYKPYDLVHTWNYPAWPTIDYYSVNPPRVDLSYQSLWELGTNIVERALDVHHRQNDMAAVVLDDPALAVTTPLRNGSAPTNGDPYTDFIVSRHLAGAYSSTGTLNATAAAAAAAAAGIGPWQFGTWAEMQLADGSGNWSIPELKPGLSWNDAWRYVMSVGPTELSGGYHHVLLALVDRAVKDSNNINRVQLVLMLVEGCAVATLLVTYMWWLQHRVTQQRYRVYGVFMAVPVGMIRALASRTITISQGSDSEEDSDDDEYQQQQVSAAKQMIARQFSIANSTGSLQGASGVLGFIANLPIFNRSGTGGGSQLDTTTRPTRPRKHARRRMILNSRDSLKLLIPFVVWGITICIIYATGYYYLHQVQAPVNLLSVIDSSLVSVHRLMLYTLMACSEIAAPAREVLRMLLATELNEFKLQWDVMLYGANSTTSGQDRRFGRIKEGVSFLVADMANVLFRQGSCHMYDQTGSCPAAADPFYAATGHGLSYMADRLVEDIEGLLAEPLAHANINSTRLAYIMTVGEGPLQAAFEVIHDRTLTIVDDYYKVVDQLHIAAMVLSWVLVVSFVFLMLRPFLRRNRGETNRIAKMLSQLPADVDIEGLVFRLLLGAPAMRRRNRRASVSSLIADDPVFAAKIAQAEAQAELMSNGALPSPFSPLSSRGPGENLDTAVVEAFGNLPHNRRSGAVSLTGSGAFSPMKYGADGGAGSRTTSGISGGSGGGGSSIPVGSPMVAGKGFIAPPSPISIMLTKRGGSASEGVFGSKGKIKGAWV